MTISNIRQFVFLPTLIFLFFSDLLSAQVKDTTIKLSVSADHPDWIYRTGEEAYFIIRVFSDNKTLKDIHFHYEIVP